MATAAAEQRNGTAQASPSSEQAPAPPQPLAPTPATSAQLQREYVAGGTTFNVYYGNILRTLPHPIDDVTSDFGDDLYERMMRDPQVAACVTVFKASILETGPHITSAIGDADDPNYDLAKEICDQTLRMLDDMEQSFNDVLWNLLDSCALGNKVAEQTYRFGPALKDGRRIMLLDKLKVKPRRSTIFAVDSYTNVVGLLVRTPGRPEPLQDVILFSDDRGNNYNLITKDKFVISTFRPVDEDPRGISMLRAAYSAWWRKQQIIPEYLKYIASFAGPSLVGKVSPTATPQPDPSNPNATLTPQQVMLAAMQAFRNGTVIAVDSGAEITPIIMQGQGDAFLRGLANCDQQITKAILTQELATEEGRHMARAAAEVHQDVLDTLVHEGKLGGQDMLRKQLLAPWVRMNWGDKAVPYAPLADFGATEERNLPAMWNAAAALMNANYLASDQLQPMDRIIGVPVRKMATTIDIQGGNSQPNAPTGGAKATPAPVPGTEDAGAGGSNPNRTRVREHERARPNRDDQGKFAPAESGSGALAAEYVMEVVA